MDLDNPQFQNIEAAAFKKSAYVKFLVSAVVITLYYFFARYHDLASDTQLALIAMTVPAAGFSVTPFLHSVAVLEAFLFLIKFYSLSLFLFLSLILPGISVDNDIAIRISLLYGLMFFVYVADFTRLDRVRMFILIGFGIIGALLLPLDPVSRFMLCMAMIFMSVIGYDGVRLREQNSLLNEDLLNKNQQLIEFAGELEQEKEKANLANEAKGEFVANMSHEIRTPLYSVTGLLSQALKLSLDDKTRDYLLRANVAADNLLAIINAVLDFSKIEAGKMEIEAGVFNLRNLLEEKLLIVHPMALKKNISLDLQVDEDVPDFIVSDSLRLGQVLVNLLGNAIKFTPNAGQVSLSLVRGAETASGLELLFAVKDNGVGMSDEHRQKLFKAFSQADTSTTRRYGGTGLGLVISNRIVKLMKGTITVDSSPGEGSTFRFNIFVESIDRSLLTDKDIVNHDFEAACKLVHGKRVLLVDDNEINLELGQEILESEGMQVELAGNGQEAIDLLADNSVDIVLMDCMMPVMDGYEATRQIRSQTAWKNLPIVAMTASALDSDKVRAMKAGMNAHVSKPVDPHQLFIIMAGLLKTSA